MMHKLHRLNTFDLRAPAMDAYEALETATLNAARGCGFENEVGALIPGWKGDAILVDLDRVERDPWIDPAYDPIEAFVQRAMGSDVHTVVVGGRVCVEDHVVTSMDVPALCQAVRQACAHGISPAQRAKADLLARIKPYMQDWYAGWADGMVDAPFYRVNSAA
jgi:cytosine/adenosine deaminase-related metal-dependent hydrolase